MKLTSDLRGFHSSGEFRVVAANERRLGRKEPKLLIIGCDYHPSVQQIAFVETETAITASTD
jgi:hypothetical protein